MGWGWWQGPAKVLGAQETHQPPACPGLSVRVGERPDFTDFVPKCNISQIYIFITGGGDHIVNMLG